MEIENIKKIAPMVTLATLLFSGCANNTTPTPTPTEINANSLAMITEDSSYTNIQNGIYSLSGLLTVPKLGFTYFHTKDREPFYQIGYGGKYSYYMTQTIDIDVPENEINTIRDGLVELRNIALTNIKRSIKSFDINSTQQDDKNEINFDEKYIDLVKKIKQKGLFLVSWNGKNSTKDKTNIQVASSNMGNLDINSLSANGFMLLKGLKVSTFYVGDDIQNHWKHIKTNIINDTQTYPKIVTTTVQAKEIYYFAEMNYNEEIENYLNLIKIQKGWKDIEIEGLINIINLEKLQYFSKLNKISSIGLTSNMDKKVYPLFFNTKNIEQNSTTQIKNINDYISGTNLWENDNTKYWQTIYSVNTNIFDIKRWFNTIKPVEDVASSKISD